MIKKKTPGGNRAGGIGGSHNRLDYTTERGGNIYVLVRRPDGRIVGRFDGDTLCKHARPDHILQRPRAWAWDCAIQKAAENAAARFTEVECVGRIYRATLADFRRYGFPVNRGYGEQSGLTLEYWQTRNVGETAPAVQLDLFGVAQ